MNRRTAISAALDVLRKLPPATDAAEIIDCLRSAEELKAAAAAAQAVDAVALSDCRRAESAVPAGSARSAEPAGSARSAEAADSADFAARLEQPGRVDAAVAREVGLALRTSPFHARRFVGWARVLTSELPATFAELAAGRTTERRAFLVTKETVFLSQEHRAAVDAHVASRLEQLGDRRTEALVREQAYSLDPAAFVARSAAATADRHVSVRPAPDCMVRLSALLPVADGVACYAALKAHADTAMGTGQTDGRGCGQIMADTLVDRLTGREVAHAGPDVHLDVIISDRTLFARGTDPAQLIGYGPLPAELARELAASAARAWLRRLYTDPVTGQLSDLDMRAREFTAGKRRFLIARDQVCRTPWCGAPIRHADHVTPYAEGGLSTVTNGQGLCAACNYSKDASGWVERSAPDGTVAITTPTGHQYESRPPDPPGAHRRPRPETQAELMWRAVHEQ